MSAQTLTRGQIYPRRLSTASAASKGLFDPAHVQCGFDQFACAFVHVVDRFAEPPDHRTDDDGVNCGALVERQIIDRSVDRQCHRFVQIVDHAVEVVLSAKPDTGCGRRVAECAEVVRPAHPLAPGVQQV